MKEFEWKMKDRLYKQNDEVFHLFENPENTAPPSTAHSRLHKNKKTMMALYQSVKYRHLTICTGIYKCM